MKKYIIALSLSAMLLTGIAPTVNAQTATTAVGNLQDLQAQIAALLSQVAQLQERLRAAQGEIKEVQTELRLARSLSLGMSGEDVRDLQEFLAADPEVYPENLVTGFYGKKTEEAVRRFQRKHGILVVGRVGPQTLRRIHSFLDGDDDDAIDKLPDNVIKRLEMLRLRNASSTPNGGGVVIICHKIGNQRAKMHSIRVKEVAVQAHLAHGDTLGRCGGENGNNNGTTTDRVAPIISAITSTNTTSNSTLIEWMTNEPADGTVWYGTTTPVTRSAPHVSKMHADLITTHSVTLDGLSASTTYYFIIVSKDASGNATASTQSSFMTL